MQSPPMTTNPPGNTRSNPLYLQHLKTLIASDKSETSTAEFTPSTTSSQVDERSLPEAHDSEPEVMEEAKEGSSTLREEIQPTKTENTAVQAEPKAPESPETKQKKSVCKKHNKASKKHKKRSKNKDESSSSDESSSTDSSSDSETDEEESEESEGEKDSEEERKQRRKQKQKAKKVKNLIEKRKAKSRKPLETSDEESESEESDESSSEEEDKRKKSKSSKKKRSKAKLDALADEQATLELQKLMGGLGRRPGHGLGGLRRRGGRQPAVDDQLLRQLAKGKKKQKQKRGSKADFVRVDQLWDSSIHNYKLTETTEDVDANEYDQYVFTVRRKFDWENKYTDTVVDIKIKPLKEALTHVMGAV